MRGSETAAAGLGINLTWQRIMIFALSGAVAGIGGTLLVIQQRSSTPAVQLRLRLAFVVIVVTTGVTTVEGAIQGGIRLRDHPAAPRVPAGPIRGNSLTFVLFAFGALTYAQHPEGILEFQKRRSMLRFEPCLPTDVVLRAGTLGGRRSAGQPG